MKNLLNKIPTVRLVIRIGFETMGLNCEFVPFTDGKIQYVPKGELLKKVQMFRLTWLIFQFTFIMNTKLSLEESERIYKEEEKKQMEEAKRMQEMQAMNSILRQQNQQPNN